MNIAEIVTSRQNDGTRRRLREAVNNDGNITIEAIETAAPAFAVTMQIASLLKKKRIDTVLVHTNKQAIAALSAKKLAEKSNNGYTIVYQPLRCDETPRNIPAEIVREVALWLFEDTAQQQTYEKIARQNLNAAAILPATTFDGADTPIAYQPKTYDNTRPLRLAFIGDITDYAALRNSVLAIGSLEHADIEYNICGTGKARHIMPIVRTARNDKRHRYHWKGNEYDRNEEIAQADIAIADQQYVTADQILLMKRGVPVLQAVDHTELAAKLAAVIAQPDTLRQMSQDAIDAYRDTYSPLFHVKQFVKILSEATQ